MHSLDTLQATNDLLRNQQRDENQLRLVLEKDKLFLENENKIFRHKLDDLTHQLDIANSKNIELEIKV